MISDGQNPPPITRVIWHDLDRGPDRNRMTDRHGPDRCRAGRIVQSGRTAFFPVTALRAFTTGRTVTFRHGTGPGRLRAGPMLPSGNGRGHRAVEICTAARRYKTSRLCVVTSDGQNVRVPTPRAGASGASEVRVSGCAVASPRSCSTDRLQQHHWQPLSVGLGTSTRTWSTLEPPWASPACAERLRVLHCLRARMLHRSV
jgi:hypothetical protein